MGILLSRMVGFARRESLVLAAVLGALSILSAWRAARWLRITCALLAMASLGVLADTWHRPGPRPELDAGAGETVILTGCVVEPTVFSADREQFTLELAPKARARVSLALRDGETPRRLDYGQRVEVEARVRRPRNFENPGSFDYAGYLARQRIYWLASARAGAPITVLDGGCGSRFEAFIFALRTAALERIERLYAGETWATGMMEAILIGESSKLEKVWTEDFRRTGTYHALVISGLHVTVLAGFLLFLLRMCLLRELPALLITALAAWLYALVSGWSAPVVRAAGGFTLYLVARLFFRRTRLMNLLAAVALAYLLLDPGQMFEASFQLSFLSVAALAALAMPVIEATSAPLARGLRGLADVDRDPRVERGVAQFRVELRLLAETIFYWTRAPQRSILAALALACRGLVFCYEMVLVSAAAQIGLALPMAVYFHRVSFTGLTANLLIVPAMEAVVPVGFAAIFTGWKLPAIVAAWLLKFSAWAAEWHAGWEPGWRIPDPPLWLALAFTVSLIALALLLPVPRWKWPALAAVLGLFALLLWQPWPAEIEGGVLELTAIDVGQGDSLLVALPERKLIVVDGGGLLVLGRRSAPRLDIGEDVVSPYLWSRRIRRVDALVATHAHQDHVGGLSSLMENFRPREFWTGANPSVQLAEHARRLGVKLVPLGAGGRFDFGGARIEVLSPPADYQPAAAPRNNDSLAFRIGYGAHSFLLTGDMERAMEQRLIDDARLSRTDVLKVAHHGSRTSTTERFLAAARPAFALISAGYENPFHHPHPDVLARLREHHSAILRTDLDGLISIRSDGRRLMADTTRWRMYTGWHVLHPVW